MRNSKFTLLFITLFVTFLNAQSTLRVAQKYLQKGNYTKAKVLLTKEAQKGNIEAIFTLAKLYKSGLGVVVSKKKALYWYKKATKKSAEANYQIGQLYEEQKKGKEAQLYYKKAIELKSIKALFALATLYYNGELIPKDISKAISLYKKAAQKGDILSNYNLGYIYQHGVGVKRGLKEAFNYYKRAARKGYLDAEYNLATLYYTGQGTKKDLQKALFWYKKAALQNDSEALYNVGLMYYKGEGVLKNKILTFQYWYQAAKNSHQMAQAGLDKLCKKSSWACH